MTTYTITIHKIRAHAHTNADGCGQNGNRSHDNVAGRDRNNAKQTNCNTIQRTTRGMLANNYNRRKRLLADSATFAMYAGNTHEFHGAHLCQGGESGGKQHTRAQTEEHKSTSTDNES
eukprot:3614727-Lingulodinium_polyedra.AAC.1